MGIRVVDKYKPKGPGRHSGYGSKRTFGQVLGTLFALIAAAALLLSCLAIFANPARFPLLLFFGFYFIPLLLLNLLILLICLLKLRKTLLIPLIALIPPLFLADRFYRFGHEEAPLTGDGFEILTYNLGRYKAGGRNVTSNESISAIRNYLAEQDADIVCLQEFAVSDTGSLGIYLPAYPYHAQHLFKGNRSFGNVTLSKHPINHVETITFPDSRNLSLVTDIDVSGRTLRIYNCHLESYSISFTGLIKRLFHKETFTDEVVQVHEKLGTATRRRSEQVGKLLLSEQESPWPTVLCGDFNDSPVSYTYQQLSKTKTDSFTEAGSGFSSTYSVLWPMLRIDYILLPREFAASRHTVARIPWSDHYPVKTHVYFEK
ncbi:MAG: endonuclease/exonuclease/phosphatase family protein [Bacteroidales bacterium]|nr:endonuclease/exonuclease/phosphatase family protein [Bacteroidales bacterium]